jgi:serine/threonine protein kinase
LQRQQWGYFEGIVAEAGLELLKPGQIFAGRYRVERFLAQGGHGAVFVAEQLATEALVAIKVLWPHLVASEEIATRFELEAKVAGRVKSDYIVRVLDAGIDEETRMPFLVMELLEGESLAECVKRNGPMSSVDAVGYILQIAHGLDKAHSYSDRDGQAHPIVHRDLKPDNVFLVAREDGHRAAKILDFGIAKVLSESATMSHGIKGTPLYMACEQASGDPITPRTDVWALGLIAFYLLAGKPYWRAATRASMNISSIFGEILYQPIIAPTNRSKEIGVEATWPSSFDTWFLRCVNRDATARFQTAGAAANALAEALLGAEWSATLPNSVMSLVPPPGSVIMPRRGWSRGRWLLFGAAGVLVGALGYLAINLSSERVVQQLSRVPSAAHRAQNGSAPLAPAVPHSAAAAPSAASSAPASPTAETGWGPAADAATKQRRVNTVNAAAPPKRAAARVPSTPSTPRPAMSSPIYTER